MALEVIQQADHCGPSEPPPTPQSEHDCTGTIQGTVRMECCCPRLMTRTFVVNIGPQSEPSLIAFILATAGAWEASGYLILGHSIVDAGAGWVFGFTVGWYV